MVVFKIRRILGHWLWVSGWQVLRMGWWVVVLV